jgi:hypothetical protein
MNVAGTVVMIDAEVRKEVEAWLRTLEYPKDHFAQLVITTILGEEVTVIADGINQIYDTNPELRFKSRSVSALVQEERLEQGFTEEGD